MKRSSIMLCSLLAAALAACESGSGIAGGDGAEISIVLTDDPGDFEAAVVTISAIYLQGGSDDDEDPEGGRVYLRTEPITTDLLTLADDLLTIVDGADVEAGTYGQLRFVIEGAYIEVETETGTMVYATPGYAEAPAQVDGELKCPSCAQSGLKVILPGSLELESETTLLVDFDVSASFGHPAGNSGKWIMHPTLKASEIDAAGEVNVAIGLGAGVTLPDLGGGALTLADFSAELKSAAAEELVPGEVVAFTDADGDGTFEAHFGDVVPGDYVVLVRGPAGVVSSTSPAVPWAVTVGPAAEVEADLTLTAVASAG